MAELVMGIKHIRDGVESQNVLAVDMSIFGIIGTAPDADDSVYPLNTAVELRTNDSTKRTSLGATGTLPDALEGISAQISGSALAAQTVLVRVEDDADPFQVIANIVGDEALKTGVWAFLEAPEELGLNPRLMISPGYTSQQAQGLADPVINNGGSGGTDGNFPLAFTGGTGSGAEGNFDVTGGAITAVTLTKRGIYTVAPTLDFSASVGLIGEDVTVGLQDVGNPVCAVMPTIIERLDAFFLPEGPSSSQQDAEDWLELIPQHQRFMHPIRQDAIVSDDQGASVTKPGSPYVIGLYGRVDSEHDGVPSHSAANREIYGTIGWSPAINLSIVDENSEGQGDLANSFGVISRGQIGVTGSLSDGGFTFWGTDTLSTDTQWLFVNVGRLRDYMELIQVKALRTYLGRYNLTQQVVTAVVNTIKAQASDLMSRGHILGYEVTFDEDQNDPDNLRLGYLELVYKAEEPPVLRKITIRSRRHEEALTDLVRAISTQLGNVTG